MTVAPPPSPPVRRATWNDPERIATHRAMSPAQRVALALEASRAALRFATGRRREAPRSGLRA